MRARLGYALFLVPALASTSCILFISPPTGGSECSFAGSDGLCGACVATNCQDDVNACCAAGDSCSDELSALEGCATTQDARCSELQTSMTGGAGDALAKCVATSCKGECQRALGTTATECSDIQVDDTSGCSCALSTSPNQYRCDATVFAATRCCAPKGWPAPGFQCACEPLDCAPDATGCVCSLVTHAPQGSPTCSGVHCCKYQSSCSCREDACKSYETAVPSCDVTAVDCPEGEEPVDGCTVVQ